MSNDPILTAIKVALGRIALFSVCAFTISVSLWILILIVVLDRPVGQFWLYTVAAFQPSVHTEVAVVGGLCATVGCLSVALLFLLAVVWWRRPRVLHVRGTRLIDTRRGRKP